MGKSNPGKIILKINQNNGVYQIMVLAYLEYTDKDKKNFKLIKPSSVFSGKEYIQYYKDNNKQQLQMTESNTGMYHFIKLKNPLTKLSEAILKLSEDLDNVNAKNCLDTKLSNTKNVVCAILSESDLKNIAAFEKSYNYVGGDKKSYNYVEFFTEIHNYVTSLSNLNTGNALDDSYEHINKCYIDQIDELLDDDEEIALDAFNNYFSKKNLVLTAKDRESFFTANGPIQCFYFIPQPDKKIIIKMIDTTKEIDLTKLPADGYIEFEYNSSDNNNCNCCIIN